MCCQWINLSLWKRFNYKKASRFNFCTLNNDFSRSFFSTLKVNNMNKVKFFDLEYIQKLEVKKIDFKFKQVSFEIEKIDLKKNNINLRSDFSTLEKPFWGQKFWPQDLKNHNLKSKFSTSSCEPDTIFLPLSPHSLSSRNNFR